MRHILLIACGAAVAWAGLSRQASAQTRRPFDDYTPPSSVSPYMNLINNNNTNSSTGLYLNYQLMVKPQLEQRSYNQQSAAAIRQMQQQVQSGSSPQGADRNQKLRATGHAATRMNYSHYYPTLTRK
jgi:flagellar basal body-associated protein FliL